MSQPLARATSRANDRVERAGEGFAPNLEHLARSIGVLEVLLGRADDREAPFLGRIAQAERDGQLDPRSLF